MLEDGSRELSKQTYPKPERYIEESKCCFTAAKSFDDSRVFCCKCAHKRRASPLTCLAICFLVLTYNLLGGFLFLAIEGNFASEETAVAASKPNLIQSHVVDGSLRSKTVERLWSITEDLNILYKENWTKLAAKELLDFQKILIKSMGNGGLLENRLSVDEENYHWTFTSSFLYALTLITTIGHGNVTPKSPTGKIVSIAYACIGIPLVMLYLSTVGEALARGTRTLYSRLRPSSRGGSAFHSKADCLPRDKTRDKDESIPTPFQAALNLQYPALSTRHYTCRGHTRVPPALGIILATLYILLGAVIFQRTEQWGILDGCYFSFSSLATIGFGALRPGKNADTPRAEDIAVGACCVYILVGIVVIAMCFNLIQEDAGAALRGVTAKCAPVSVVHSNEQTHNEVIALASVSS